MRLKIIQPIMVLCDKLGFISGVRFVQLVVDADNVEYYAAKRPEANALYTDFTAIHINAVLEKHVRTISLEYKRDQYARVRESLCSQISYRNNRGIRGVNKAAIMKSDGTVVRSELFAAIASRDSQGKVESKANIMFFDYKGNMYTEEQLIAEYDWAKAEIYQLRNSAMPSAHIMNTLMCDEQNRYEKAMSFFAPDYAILQPDTGEIAAKELIGSEQETVAYQSGRWVYEFIKSKIALIRIPQVCSVVDIGSVAFDTWQLIGHANIDKLYISGTTLPLFKNFEYAHEVDICVTKSEAPMQLPHVAARPGGELSRADIVIDMPYFEDTVNYVDQLADCHTVHVLVGEQQGKRVLLPDARQMTYTTKVCSDTFTLVFDRMHYKYGLKLCDSTTDHSRCNIGLSIDARDDKHNLLLNLQKAAYARTSIVLGAPTYQTGTVVNTVIKLQKHAEVVQLYTERCLNEHIYGDSIGELCYHAEPYGTVQTSSCLHVYAHVNCLRIYLDDALLYKPIYLHGGVDEVQVILLHSPCYELLKHSYACIHIPKGTITHIYNPLTHGKMVPMLCVQGCYTHVGHTEIKETTHNAFPNMANANLDTMLIDDI